MTSIRRKYFCLFASKFFSDSSLFHATFDFNGYFIGKGIKCIANFTHSICL